MNKNLKLMVLVGLGGAGIYLLWKGGYLAEWLPSVFGKAIEAGATSTTTATNNTQTAAPPASQTQPANKPTGVPALDVSGLVVEADVNDSLAGTVKIQGKPTRLAIIQSDGRIFDGSGKEVSELLSAQGVDLEVLRAAFTMAGNSLSGLAGLGWTA